MTRPVRFNQRDVETAIRGAIRGGLEPGTFAIVMTPATGEVRILPARPEAGQGDDLDRELADWRARHGDG